MSIQLAPIIPKNSHAVEIPWQKELANAFSRPQDLLRFVGLSPQKYLQDSKARALFAMRVPRPFAARIQFNNPDDPLLRQVLPLKQEFEDVPGYVADPLLEQQNSQPGLLHKYQSRVLLIVRGGCAVNCRYCFRRHFPYSENSMNRQGWQAALQHIAEDNKINEVIFSGGDPLMAKDDFLGWLAEQITAIPHVKRLRIHTRLPVVIPSRITEAFVRWFTGTRLKPVMIVHINHAQEIDDALRHKLQLLHSQGVTLLNQAVLLKGVNDSANALCDLSETLFESDVLPYYLHVLDKVQGAAHFDVPEAHARDLAAEMIKRLPGFLVPKLVREIGGQPGKTPLDLHLHP